MSDQLETDQPVETPEVEDPQEVVEPAEPEVEEPDDAGFDGEFDAKRARRTIDRLRDENKQLQKQNSQKPKDSDLAKENLQLRAAIEMKLPVKLAARLHGDTVEEMIEDAAELLDALGVKGEDKGDGAQRAPRREPRPKLSGGSQPDAEPELTPEQIVAKALGL